MIVAQNENFNIQGNYCFIEKVEGVIIEFNGKPFGETLIPHFIFRRKYASVTGYRSLFAGALYLEEGGEFSVEEYALEALRDIIPETKREIAKQEKIESQIKLERSQLSLF